MGQALSRILLYPSPLLPHTLLQRHRSSRFTPLPPPPWGLLPRGLCTALPRPGEPSLSHVRSCPHTPGPLLAMVVSTWPFLSCPSASLSVMLIATQKVECFT